MPNNTHDWSVQQEAIFDWFARGRDNLVVRARAGTGKTTTIIEGIERAPERNILMAAFNTSIAKELQRRINNPRAESKTLHGLGYKFILRNWNGIKVDDTGKRAKDLAIQACGNGAPDPMINLVKALHTKAREIKPFASRPEHLIELAIRFDLLPDEDWEEQGWDKERVCECALAAMELAKVRPLAIDFADMIYLPLVHNWVRPWFDLVVVDEAQDMTVAQLKLATGACRRGGRICVVGDDRQAIYGFRGADSQSLDRLKSELHATELGLTTTYRCPKLVVQLASQIVRDFNAAPSAPQGTITNTTRDKMIEIAKEGDFILSRTNAPLVRVCMALLKLGTRARIKGRDIGRGITALIRRMKPQTIIDLGIKMGEWQAQELDRAMVLPDKEVAAERVAFVGDQFQLVMALMEGAATVSELEGRLNELFTDDAERQAVMCSTVHKAKGLESGRVFLLEGTFRAGRTEEDNIRYVAITRSKSELFWVSGFGKESK